MVSGRWQRVLTEVYRFLAVGGLATIVAFVLFNVLAHGFGGLPAPLRDQPYLAFVVANLAGMVVSYRGSRRWVFKDRPPRTADGGRSLFVLINLVTMLIPIACLWVSRNVLDLDDPVSDNLAANVIGLFLGMVARFYLFRTVVFRRPVMLADLRQHPLQVLEMSELTPTTAADQRGPAEPPVRPESEPSTARSTSDRARRPAP